jgi:hypothetical protein
MGTCNWPYQVGLLYGPKSQSMLATACAIKCRKKTDCIGFSIGIKYHHDKYYCHIHLLHGTSKPQYSSITKPYEITKVIFNSYHGHQCYSRIDRKTSAPTTRFPTRAPTVTTTNPTASPSLSPTTSTPTVTTTSPITVSPTVSTITPTASPTQNPTTFSPTYHRLFLLPLLPPNFALSNLTCAMGKGSWWSQSRAASAASNA